MGPGSPQLVAATLREIFGGRRFYYVRALLPLLHETLVASILWDTGRISYETCRHLLACFSLLLLLL